MKKAIGKNSGIMIIALILSAAVLSGCSDFGTLTSSSTGETSAAPSATPEFREVTVVIEMIISPFGDEAVTSMDYGFVEMNSVRIEPNDPFDPSETPDFCSQLTVEADHKEIALSDCTSGRFAAKQIKISSLSKKVLRVKATVSGKVRNVIIDPWDPIGKK
jgi:PBP1b-binding outer membrane lipoprotein LpoB